MLGPGRCQLVQLNSSQTKRIHSLSFLCSQGKGMATQFVFSGTQNFIGVRRVEIVSRVGDISSEYFTTDKCRFYWSYQPHSHFL